MPKYKRLVDDEMRKNLDFISKGSIQKASQDNGMSRGTLQYISKNRKSQPGKRAPLILTNNEIGLKTLNKFQHIFDL